jgi:excisionase family DNA binding protein
MSAPLDYTKTITPSPTDCEGARLLARALEAHSAGQTDWDANLSDNLRMAVVQLLSEMGKGNSVAIVAIEQELTPQQAADLLKISRTLLMRAIKNNSIPYKKVGSHYRLLLTDVLAHKKRKEEQRSILRELIEEAQELNMGY